MQETADLIARDGHEVHCVQADVTVEADCARLVQAAIDTFGRIDILHNNVGIGAMDGDTAKLDRSEWERVFDINLTGAMLLSKHVLPSMRANRSGCITHVSSCAAVLSSPLIAYKTSKAALNEFTRWLAIENAPYNIRCNVLMLGMIDTPMAIEGYHVATGTPRDELRAQRDAKVPMGRMGTPWESARVALFLASDDAAYVTGAILPVDGGLTTRVG